MTERVKEADPFPLPQLLDRWLDQVLLLDVYPLPLLWLLLSAT